MYRNINLGISVDRSDNKKKRWIQMLKIAFGQSKMIDKPVVGILHIVVYVGFHRYIDQSPMVLSHDIILFSVLLVVHTDHRLPSCLLCF